MSGIKEHLKHHGQTTSLKGVSKIIKSKHYVLKLVWLIALLCGASIAAYMLTTLIRGYLKYESIGQISQCTNCQPEFPDVTVCNLNPLALTSYFEEDLLQFYEYLGVINSFTQMSEARFQDLQRKSNMTQDKVLYLRDVFYSLAGYFHNINDSKLLEKVGDSHLVGSLVSFCEWYDWQDRTYTKEDCMEQSLYFFSTPDYSVCTTIHINHTNTISNKTDVKGFEALLYLNDFHRAIMLGYGHNILLSQARGVRVLIHPPNTLPEMRKGFNIAPGHEVSIHLEAREVVRQPAPYSDCTDKIYLEDEVTFPVDGTSQILQFMYSDQDAVSLCQQENIVKKCGCFHPSLPVTKHLQAKYQAEGCIKLLYENSTVRLSQVNFTDFDLASTLRNMACYFFADKDEEHQQKSQESCIFRQPCKETIYNHKVYQSPWPHESYQLAFYCRHIDNTDENCWKVGYFPGEINLSPWFKDYAVALDKLYLFEDFDTTYSRLLEENLIQRNFIQLKVFFVEKKIEFYKDVPSLTVASLTGTMGGVLNLWIGITFFTLIEFVDFVYTLIVDVWLKKTSNQVKKEKADDSKVHPLDEGFRTSSGS